MAYPKLSAPMFLLMLSACLPASGYRQRCRSIPGDAGWPTADAWSKLNDTVSGRLIATVPLAAPCYEKNYDAQKCAYVTEQWRISPVHIESPSSFMAPPFYNNTCQPFQSDGKSCPLGNLVAYSINASQAADIVAGIKFAREQNIRLVIKNTGHDYLGRSTGKGALGIWTHNLNAIEPLLNYSSYAYHGAALKMGAGVLTEAAYAAAHRVGHRVVGGVCPTVGLAGGYSLGGGHSPLAPLHGLGADNVLEWEVVTANGTHARAAPDENADLYWALSGGGGGTYAVVVSMTARMHRDAAPTGGAKLFINATLAPSPDAFWAAIDAAHADLAPIVDSGAYLNTILTRAGAALLLTAPGQSPGRVRRHMRPLVQHLDRQRVPYLVNYTQHASYFEHFGDFYGAIANDYSAGDLVTSRLVPRDFMLAPASRASLTQLYRSVTADEGWSVLNIAMTAPPGARVANNSVHPAWRSALSYALIYGGWNWREAPDAQAARQARLNRVVEPALRALLPHSPPYVNEANYALPDVVALSYGPNLARLRDMKRRYDPDDVFYAPSGVGSEVWIPDADGRLCRQT